MGKVEDDAVEKLVVESFFQLCGVDAMPDDGTTLTNEFHIGLRLRVLLSKLAFRVEACKDEVLANSSDMDHQPPRKGKISITDYKDSILVTER